MEVAVFGGSFNPPHVGHALVCGWVHWVGLVDEVWLVPTKVHPFAKELLPFSRRVTMCRALGQVVGDWVRVCEIENELPTPSYTIDTLNALATRHGEHRFRLLVGADVLDEVDEWKRWDSIVEAYSPIVVGRQGYRALPRTIDFPGVSSTEVRRRLAAGEPVEHLVPAAVRREFRAVGDQSQ